MSKIPSLQGYAADTQQNLHKTQFGPIIQALFWVTPWPRNNSLLQSGLIQGRRSTRCLQSPFYPIHVLVGRLVQLEVPDTNYRPAARG